MRVNGKTYEVSDDAPIGYELRAGRPAAARCPRPSGPPARDDRPRRHRRHRHRGARRASSPTATARGCPSACASAACRWRTSWSSATGRPTCGPRSTSSPREGVDLILTSGGLGPTADDLTAEVVGALRRPADGARRRAGGADPGDPAAQPRALAVLREAAMREGNRKQAMVPEGATILEPVGTAPGLVVPPARRATGRSSPCSPARRGSCGRCGTSPWRPPPLRGLLARRRARSSSGCCGSTASRSR